MLDLTRKYTVLGPDGVPIGEIVRGEFYHLRQPNPEGILRADGLYDGENKLIARLEGNQLIRVNGHAVLTLVEAEK